MYFFALLITLLLNSYHGNPFAGVHSMNEFLGRGGMLLVMLPLFPIGLGFAFSFLGPIVAGVMAIGGYLFYVSHLVFTMTEKGKRLYTELTIALAIALCINIAGCTAICGRVSHIAN